MNTQVVILAGGFATRLGLLTKSRPKSMVIVNGKPFLQYQIENLRSAGVENILLCTGYLGEQISDYFGDGRRFGLTIEYSKEEKPLGTAGALKHAEPQLEDVFITLYGDSYLSINLAEIMTRFYTENKLGMMTVYKNSGRYDKSNTAIVGNLVVKYDKQNRDGMVYIDYGLNVFRKKVLDFIPANEYYSLEEVFCRLIEMKELIAFEMKERFYEIGSPSGLAEFQQLVGGVRI